MIDNHMGFMPNVHTSVPVSAAHTRRATPNTHDTARYITIETPQHDEPADSVQAADDDVDYMDISDVKNRAADIKSSDSARHNADVHDHAHYAQPVAEAQREAASQRSQNVQPQDRQTVPQDKQPVKPSAQQAAASSEQAAAPSDTQSSSENSMKTDEQLKKAIAMIKDLQNQVSVLEAKAEKSKSDAAAALNQRDQAYHDLANYKKRAEAEKDRARTDAIASVGKAIMPAIDDLERAIDQYAQYENDDTLQSVAAGCENIRKKLLSSLESLGIEQIDPTGKEFNPDEAMAVFHEEHENAAPNTVFATYQHGYKIGDKVIRTAQVGVAK